MSLVFERVANLPARARTELTLTRWKIAGPAAYPELITGNTPGGGVSSNDARDLIALLDAIPQFAEAHADELEDEELGGFPGGPIEWTDARSGVTLRYAGEGSAGVEESVALGDEIRWQIRAILHEMENEIAPDATKDEVIALVNERLQARLVGYNARPQAELRGVSPAQVHRLLRSDWSDDEGALRLRRGLTAGDLAGSEILRYVSALLALVAERGGVGRTQAGNLQMAVVRELIGRAGLDEFWGGRADGHGSRRTREQDVWPMHEARILADLAGLLRTGSTRFGLTRRGHELLARDRAGELFALLFETCFRRFNIFYDGFEEWPELQHQIAFTLLRLGQLRDGWHRADDLLEDVVLPFAIEHAPDMGGFLDPLWLLERHVLWRLVEFGLMERRKVGNDRDSEYRPTPLFARFLSFAL